MRTTVAVAFAALFAVSCASKFCGPDTCAGGCCSVDDQCVTCGGAGGGAGGGGTAGGGQQSGTTTLNFRIENEYAESIFTADVTVESPADGGVLTMGDPAGTKKRLFDNERIAGSGQKSSGIMVNVPENAVLFFEIEATSLGQKHSFSGREPVSDRNGKRLLRFVYDYDIALAKFGVRYGWAD